MATDEILEVSRVSREQGEYIVKCPHCGAVIGLEGDDLSEMRGEQYHHKLCGGWLMVGYDARYVKEL